MNSFPRDTSLPNSDVSGFWYHYSLPVLTVCFSPLYLCPEILQIPHHATKYIQQEPEINKFIGYHRVSVNVTVTELIKNRENVKSYSDHNKFYYENTLYTYTASWEMICRAAIMSKWRKTTFPFQLCQQIVPTLLSKTI